MANKRQLKKRISYVCGDLAAEILLAAHLVEGVDKEAARKIVSQIAALQTSARAKASFAYEKAEKDFENRHQYNVARHQYNSSAFKKLREEFTQNILSLVKEMNAALPESARQQFKESVK